MQRLQHNNKGNDCRITFDDGAESEISSKELFQNYLHQWPGWSCAAGFSVIYVYADGSVYSCESRNNYLGSLNDNSFSLLPEPTVCKMPQCSNNPTELKAKKFKINK
jgi:hypothetical protein